MATWLCSTTFWLVLHDEMRRPGRTTWAAFADTKFGENNISGRKVMDFLSQLLRGIAFVPALVSGIEGLFGNKPGAEKKDAAMSFLQNALAMTDAVATREIISPEKFRDGMS